MMSTFEKILIRLIIIHAFLLFISQWFVLYTPLHKYVNPVYDYIGVSYTMK